MSVIGKKPFVNYIINELNKTQVSTLASLMDNLGSPTLVSLYGTENLISNSNKGVTYVMLKMEQLTNETLNGILIFTDNDHCGLFVINNDSPIIAEFKIDPVNRTYAQINEHCSAEELRQICGDRIADIEVSSVTASDINSGTATNGQVLTANGSGGAAWADAGASAGLVFTNVSASSWTADETYADYGYKCELSCTGITADSVVEVIFGVTEANSGNYAPVCASGAGTVTIYAKVNDTITIPVIKEIL